jgi:hypothetical protein
MTELTHEMCEAITNPLIYSGGWVATTAGFEIGDLCQTQSTPIAGYNVQPLWINGQGCVGA